MTEKEQKSIDPNKALNAEELISDATGNVQQEPFSELAAATANPFKDVQSSLKALAIPRSSLSALAQAPNIKATQTISTPRDLGNLIRKVREANGVSQQQLADLAGVGRRFLSELENGKHSLEFGKVLSVASAAGIDLLANRR